LLGTDDVKCRKTTYYFVSDDEAEPKVRATVESTSTWYDSRRKQKSRRPEWRLYYPKDLKLVQEFCSPDDLLLLALRNDDSLAVFLAPKNSVSEQMLLKAFSVTAQHYKQSGNVRWMKTERGVNLDYVSAAAFEQLSLALEEITPLDEHKSGIASEVIATPEEVAHGDLQVAEVAARMIELWPYGQLGKSRDVVKLVTEACDPKNEAPADAALERWLEVAEAAYRMWEKQSACLFLAPLRHDPIISDLELVERLETRWMSFRQSRVTRAGKVMEEFLNILFTRARLRFSTGSEAKTESGKLPDFVFPDGGSYRNPEFPTGLLRILGSKTSFKDRWRQILSEGDRVSVKHGVTRDALITAPMFKQMEESGFVVVMPKPIIDRYESCPPNLISLASFITEVQDLQK
jgi:hypothetical protein